MAKCEILCHEKKTAFIILDDVNETEEETSGTAYLVLIGHPTLGHGSVEEKSNEHMVDSG